MGRVATKKPVCVEREEVPRLDGRLGRFEHGPVKIGVLAVSPFQEGRKLFVGPPLVERHAIGPERVEHAGVPRQVQFPDAVVRDRQLLRSPIGREPQITALYHHQLTAVRRDHACGDSEALGDFKRLVPRDQQAVAVCEDGSAGAELPQRGFQETAAAGRPLIRVVGVGLNGDGLRWKGG